MKISYNWLKEYINTSQSVESIASILTDTGLEVESVKSTHDDADRFGGLVVGEVMKCWPHPEADRLNLTLVDIGEAEHIQIVCGAPNVAEGQKVCVATIGSTLSPSTGDPFKIKKGKIRGEVSFGMLCAEDEIGLGESHDGIMVLKSDTAVGTAMKDYLNTKEDYTLEIGLTPNRADAFSHIGVARDLAAALKHMQGIEQEEGARVIWPKIDHFPNCTEKSKISITVEDEEACPRYAGLTINGIKVGPSPEWLQERLASIGLSPINNVVDVTNFVLHEMGQPLHAFDSAKIKGQQVIVKTLKEGSLFTTLDGAERKLSGEDLMICDREGGMCIAGVFGGLNSGVSENTTEIFLESAFFNPVSVRKTAKRHVLSTDASFRFERGVDPNITILALKRAALLIEEVSGGKINSSIFDSNPKPVQPKEVNLNLLRLNKLIGMEMEKSTVLGILKSLDIEVSNEASDDFILAIPPYRVDVFREADVIEEILRIYGFNTVPIPGKLNASLSYAPKPNLESIRYTLSGVLSSRGLTEIMSNSLTKVDYTKFSEHEKPVVKILNPLSSELGIMRQNLLFGGLEAAARNINHKQENLRMFEFGKVYYKKESGYGEDMRLGLFMTGLKLPENWNNTGDSISFIDLKSTFDEVIRSLRIGANLTSSSSVSSYFSEGMSYSIGRDLIAELGIVSKELRKAIDVRQNILYADIHWDLLMKYLPKSYQQIKEIEKYPAVRRDLSLLLNAEVKFGEIERAARKAEKQLLREVGLFDIYEGDKLEKGKKSYALSFVLQDGEKTLNDKQIEGSMGRILSALQTELGAELRG